MLNRRDFLRLGGGIGVGTASLVHKPFKTIAHVAAASAAVADRTAEDVAPTSSTGARFRKRSRSIAR